MAATLLAITSAEMRRGPCLVFAHNAHLQRNQSSWQLAGMDLRWWSAGAITASVLSQRYTFIASDLGCDRTAGLPSAEPGSLQALLYDATPGSALIPADRLAAALARHCGLHARDASANPGYLPLKPGQTDGIDAVAFIKDTAASQARQ